MLSNLQRSQMLNTPCGNIDLVIDSDAFNEIDDQYAIAYALCAQEQLNVKAIYAAPFVNRKAATPKEGMEKSYQEIKKLLLLAGADRRVLRGSEQYLPDERHFVSSSAAEDLASLAMAYSPEKPLYVAAIGAITNIASALLMNPAIAERMVVIWLGGNALEWPHNREFNIRQDVAAARVVFGSSVPLVMLPCFGVVSSFTTTEYELNHWLLGKNPLCDYLVQNTVREAESYAMGHVWSRCIWDAAAVGWLLNRDGRLMKDRLIPTPVPEYDHHWHIDPQKALCRYVYYIQRDALFEDMFLHLSQGCGKSRTV